MEALKVGAWDYLSKPVHDFEMMLHRIDQVLNKALLLKENRMYRNHLEELVDERTKELKENERRLSESLYNTILVLSQTIEAK